jgi:aminoglycoside 3-N-acetyltransferase
MYFLYYKEREFIMIATNQIDVSKSFMTKEKIMNQLKQNGVKEGMTIIVHSSLSSLGWVCGGEVAVVQALKETISKSGTIVMPTQTTDNSDPCNWENPAVPKEWWEDIRQNMPAYDPVITPSYGMGKIVENFRVHPDVVRSSHPTVSFAAWGKHAKEITSNHSLDFPFGEHSPLAKLYERESYVLLLGVDYDSCTTMHLAENRLPHTLSFTKGTAMFENGKRVWREFFDIDGDSDRFPEVAKSFEAEYGIQSFQIGDAKCRLVPVKELVDFTYHWFEQEAGMFDDE